jgi:membrane protease YdiL (CAAX protease family)
MAIFLAGFCVLQLAGHALALFNPNDLVQAAAAIAMLAAQWALLLAALWPLCRGETFARLRRGLGWHAGRGIFREIGSGILGYLAGLPIVALGLVATIALIMIFGFQPSHPIQEQARDSGIVNVILLFLLASVWAPLVEETMFRGAMYHAMRRWMAPVLSALIVAFLFAAIHPQGISTIPVLMSLAFVFAMIREWRGSLLGPMIAHALHNSILITLNVILLG